MSRRGSIDMRRKAWRRFQELPMPTVRDEEWMRTDIRLFKLDRFELPDRAAQRRLRKLPCHTSCWPPESTWADMRLR